LYVIAIGACWLSPWIAALFPRNSSLFLLKSA
jgi:hypothetical protein